MAATLCANNGGVRLDYYYDEDGVLAGKAVNGRRVNYWHDLRGQLIAVTDENGHELERYTYDPAGNRLSKTVGGKTTTYAYDGANQLISETTDGVTRHYAYDAAGRMTRAGDKTYHYDGRGKLTEVRRNGNTIAKFEFDIDGRLSRAIYGDRTEEFVWDGLALVWRSGVAYVNEPALTGGNPVLAGGDVLFNDMLGNTLATGDESVEMTAFGETENNNVFFTGKPYVEELGYSFLLRNYSPEQGKWTSADPMGYPDGWNNLAYCNNRSTEFIDWLGAIMRFVVVDMSAMTRTTYIYSNIHTEVSTINYLCGIIDNTGNPYTSIPSHTLFSNIIQIGKKVSINMTYNYGVNSHYIQLAEEAGFSEDDTDYQSVLYNYNIPEVPAKKKLKYEFWQNETISYVNYFTITEFLSGFSGPVTSDIYRIELGRERSIMNSRFTFLE